MITHAGKKLIPVEALLEQPDSRVPRSCFIEVVRSEESPFTYIARFYTGDRSGDIEQLRLIGSDLDRWLTAAIPDPSITSDGRSELVDHSKLIRKDHALYRRHATHYVGEAWRPYHQLHHQNILAAIEAPSEQDIRNIFGLEKQALMDMAWGGTIPQHFPLIERLAEGENAHRFKLNYGQSHSVIELYKGPRGKQWYNVVEEAIVPEYQHALSPSIHCRRRMHTVHIAPLQSMSSGELLGISMVAALSKPHRELVPKFHISALRMEQVHMPLWLYMHLQLLICDNPLFAKLEQIAEEGAV